MHEKFGQHHSSALVYSISDLFLTVSEQAGM
jgi:hypothetical protein